MLYNIDFAYIDSLVEKVKIGESEPLFELFEYYKPLINFSINQLRKRYSSIEKDDLMTDSIFILKDLCIKYDKDKCYFTYFLETRFKPYLLSKIKSQYISKIDIISLDEVEESLFLDEKIITDFDPIHEALEQLSPDQKQVIDLFFFCNLTQQECAEILEISQPAFSKKLKKILNQIKKICKQL